MTVRTYLDGSDLKLVDGVYTTAIKLSDIANYLVPSGAIIMWSGAIVNIPTGWYLCNGSNGTPDLRNKFIVGAGDTYAVGATGGEATHALTEAELGTHDHTITHTHQVNPPATNSATDGAHVHNLNVASGSGTSGWYPQQANKDPSSETGKVLNTNSAHYHSVDIAEFTSGASSAANTGNAGNGTAHENRPPYYALAYIMKA